MSTKKTKLEKMGLKYECCDERPELTLTLRAKCSVHPFARTNHLHFTFADTCATVSDGKGGKLGEVVGALGGMIELHDEASRLTFTISAQEFWAAFQPAIQAHSDYKECCEKRKI